jgi:hypothetical protein
MPANTIKGKRLSRIYLFAIDALPMRKGRRRYHPRTLPDTGIDWISAEDIRSHIGKAWWDAMEPAQTSKDST